MEQPEKARARHKAGMKSRFLMITLRLMMTLRFGSKKLTLFDYFFKVRLRRGPSPLRSIPGCAVYYATPGTGLAAP
jgi:hypothetical protein